jgi:hypothetical protein
VGSCNESMDRLLDVSEELTLDESVYLVEPVSQALESIFIHRGNPPRRISSEAARWCALNRSAFHQDETSYDSECDAAAVDDDDDDMRGVVKDKLLRPWSAGMMVKRIEEGSQGHYPLQGADQDSSTVAAESQASLLPANKIDAGFFKSHAQRTKKSARCSDARQGSSFKVFWYAGTRWRCINQYGTW